jgi:KaiC/GvpD/RAD55 family RecA-like ATPase
VSEGTLEFLLKKAKELEKKYEWLQATKLYDEASGVALKKQDFLKASELQARKGFCFFRAAFQAQTNIEFQKLLKKAIQAYQKESEIIGAKEADNQLISNQVNASIAYTQSWLETNVPKKKKLLDEWWVLENQVLKAYQSIRDLHSIGVTCTDMIEFSQYTRIWFSDYQERRIMEDEALNLAGKAIESLLESGDDFELARAYCFASLWYTLRYQNKSPEFKEKRAQILQKCQDYSKKALDLSLKIGDAWLIGNSHISAKKIASSRGTTFKLAAEYIEKILHYGRITKDKRIISIGVSLNPVVILALVEFLEDPDKQREVCEKTRKLAQECIHASKIIGHMIGIFDGYSMGIVALNWLSTIETDPSKRQAMLKNNIKTARQVLELAKGLKVHGFFYPQLSVSLSLLARTKSDHEEKKALLIEAHSYQEKGLAYLEEFLPFNYGIQSLEYYLLALRQKNLADIETCKKTKVEILENAVATLEKSVELIQRVIKPQSESIFNFKILGKHNYGLARILQQIYYLTKEEKRISRAIEIHRTAATAFTRGELPAHAAEAYWQIAQLQGQIDEKMKASQNYESASIAYKNAAIKISQLKDFYIEYSQYMQAWSQIEQARFNHLIEEYEKAKQQYEKAAELHESTEHWSYLAPNYFAWANMEEAESLSRNEKIQQAKHTFQEALQHFSHAKESIKQKLEEITTSEEKEMTHKLFEASDLRRKYCQARILVEEAKLLDREGKYLQSSIKYREAAQNISVIVDKVDVEAERKELEYVAILCKAWGKMADAEEATSAESYLEAAELFEQAKNRCYTKKASLWALGNSNFCRGLAAGLQYKTSLDLADHAKAKGYIKTASNDYLQAGFKNASEYAKATQRLFDAYVIMNQAEGEINQEKRAKQYQMAENLLQIAAGSFMKAKQPEKTAQVQQILDNVREEKALAVSLSQVMQAPSIASTTSSFTALTPTGETSVGLESFDHANVQANLVTQVKEVKVGESFCLSVEFVNAGREPALLLRVDDFVHQDFVVVKKPEIYRLEESALNMKGKQLAPLKTVEVKLTLQPSKKGKYRLNPKVHYLDELGQNKSLQLKTLEIEVEEVTLEDRVSTGTQELDSLLLGGIPSEYAVVLTGSPSDEREYLISNFLEAGIKEDEINFHISTEAEGLETILEKPNFYLFLCNPKPKTQIPDLPNVYKLHSKTDLTNLGISLAKAIRSIDKDIEQPKRICVEILSDVLMSHGPNTTRKWISGLITDMGAKGFTMLAVMYPKMHPVDQSEAILALFDGEIELTQTEDPLECRKSVRVKKLRNQDYIKNPICLKIT